MIKQFTSAIGVIVAMVGLVGLIQTAPVGAKPGQGGGAPAGNNGTIKVGGVDVTDDNNGNDPHIDGCTVQVEFFGYDLGPRSATVTFESQAPTPNTLVSPTGPQAFNFTGGGVGGQLDGTAQYNLAFQGAPQQNQGYHVKVTVHADGSQGNDTKSKVFWVEGCAGTSSYGVECESLTLLAPTTQPQGAAYQYYLNGQPIALGTHTLAAGEYTLTLRVNTVLVDTDEITIEACVEPVAELSYSYVCDVKTETFTITFTNSGDADGDVTFNGEVITVPANDSVVRSLPAGQAGLAVTLVIDGQTVIDRSFFCIQGRGNVDGGTPTTPVTGSTPKVASLPVTAGSSDQAAALIVSLLTGATAVTGYMIRRRADSVL